MSDNKVTDKKPGSIYLIPNLLGETGPHDVLPSRVFQIIKRLRYYIAEDIRTARRFLKKAGIPFQLDEVSFNILNKHTLEEDIPGFLSPAFEGNDTGIISEAGIPCVADPGSEIVSMAHEKGLRVIPLTGPSSIFLALMASGLNGQSFIFHGYLPVKPALRYNALKKIENDSAINNRSQIFMETPYRNMKMVESILSVCQPSARLCIACDITMPTEFISTNTILGWRKKKPDIHKRLVIFILQA